MIDTDTREQADLLETLDKHRFFLRHTLRNLTDQQARQRTTVSSLTLGGLVKHVTAAELQWTRFIADGPSAIGNWQEADLAAYAAAVRDDRAGLGRVAAGRLRRGGRRDDELVRRLPDLDDSHPLPEAPWFAPGAAWSARRALLHIIAETAQHAGHADIIRESLDGAKTMA